MKNTAYQQGSLLFSFEPGDGTSYWVLFGHQHAHWGTYTLFGFGEHGTPLITFPFQNLSGVSFDTFARSLRFNQSASLYLGESDYIEQAAWTVFCELVGQRDGGMGLRGHWHPGWQRQLPHIPLAMDTHTL